MKASVAERALLRRVNRILSADNETMLRCPEHSPHYSTLGRFYIVRGGSVVNTHVDIERVARNMGAMRVYEQLV
jgi:hypothetical protein